MNEEAKDLLKTILKKDVNDLTQEDRAFLRARSEYLTKDQKQEYADLMKVKSPPVEEFTADNNPQEVRDMLGDKNLDEMPKNDLKEMAKKLGVAHSGLNREDLLLAVRTNLGPEAADKPE